MIKIERAYEVPAEILASASPIAAKELDGGKFELAMRLQFSEQLYIAIENGVPLFAAGAFKFSNFDNELEMWMIGTNNLKARHLHKLKKLFLVWHKTRDERVFAQAQDRQSARFLEFFGFKLVDFLGPNMLYEVKKC